MELCAPSIFYLVFSLVQIVMHISKGLYNNALMEVLVMLLVTLLINTLCEKKLTAIAWIVVFLPFFFMTVVVGILLYAYGLDPATGIVSNYVPPYDTTNNNPNTYNEYNTGYNALASQPSYYPNTVEYNYTAPPPPPPQYSYPQPTPQTTSSTTQEQYPRQPYGFFSAPPPPPPQLGVYSPPNSPYTLPPAITPPKTVTINAGWVPDSQSSSQ